MSVLKSNCLKLEVISSSEFYDFMTHINTRFAFQVLYNLKKNPKQTLQYIFLGFLGLKDYWHLWAHVCTFFILELCVASRKSLHTPGYFYSLPHTVSAWDSRRGVGYGKKIHQMLNTLIWLPSHRQFLVSSAWPVNKCGVCAQYT